MVLIDLLLASPWSEAKARPELNLLNLLKTLSLVVGPSLSQAKPAEFSECYKLNKFDKFSAGLASALSLDQVLWFGFALSQAQIQETW